MTQQATRAAVDQHSTNVVAGSDLMHIREFHID